MTGATLSEGGARQIFDAWMASDPHRAILRSDVDNYVGLGVATATDGSMWVSLIATQSPDHTPPVASTVSLRRSGRTLTYTLARRRPGAPDARRRAPLLRRPGPARRPAPGASSATTRRRPRSSCATPPGSHWYWFRVQAADRRGTLSAWTTPVRIWVP